MKIKVKDVLLLAKALEREATHMNSQQKEDMFENYVKVDLKEEDVAAGRLMSTLHTMFSYAILHNNRSKNKTQENILLRVEVYDIDENRRPVVTRVEQETAQLADTPLSVEKDDVPF